MDYDEDEISRPSSPALSVISFRSSVHGSQLLREVSGRVLNAQNETYMLPADSEEHGRHSIQHHVLRMTMDSLYAAPDLVHRALAPSQDCTPAILDIGSGSGVWAIEMAQEFMHADVVGLDLVPPTLTSAVPKNCRFEVDDANLPLSHYAKSFNVVHARSLDHGIYSYEDFINSAGEILRTGGVLLLVSGDNQLYAEDKSKLPNVEEGEPGYSATTKIFLGVEEAAGARGGDPKGPEKWSSYLSQDPMWTDVGSEEIFIPIGPWLPNLTPYLRGIAELLQRDVIKIIRAFKPLLVEEGFGDEEEMDKLIETAVDEVMSLKLRSYARWRYAWASRTNVPWTPTPGGGS